MKSWLLDCLRCPICEPQRPLALEGAEHRNGEIGAGHLVCSGCGTRYPIEDGIPRFVRSGEDYCENFGFQWRRWKEIQIDGLGGHTLSQTRFFADSGWSAQWLEGKLILDGGCGAGRFSDVAARAGAKVVACDLSRAVDACRDNTAGAGDVAWIQASLLQLPLARGMFDGVFCMGVLQHTPDPRRIIETLPSLLRPGGRLAYNFYERDFWPYLQVIKYALRLITPHLSQRANLALSEMLVAALFPVSERLARIPKIRILNHFLPICSTHPAELSREQQYAWTLLDTFDWYAPRYEQRQKYLEVMEWLRAGSLEDVSGRPGIVTARAPEAP